MLIKSTSTTTLTLNGSTRIINQLFKNYRNARSQSLSNQTSTPFGSHTVRHYSITTDKLQPFTVDYEIENISNLIEFTSELLYDKNSNQIIEDKNIFNDDMPSTPPQLRYWFRGHACATWDLVPTIYRFSESSSNGYLEKQLITSFRLNHPDHFSEEKSLLNTISTMQHYHYPTRLLDWSSNIMFAAYFACSDETQLESDGAIWILNPFILNSHATLTNKPIGIALMNYFDVQLRCYQAIAETYDELIEHSRKIAHHSYENPEKFTTSESVANYIDKCHDDEKLRNRLKLPIAVEPGSINPRVTTQKGKFTVASGKLYFSRKSGQKLRLFDKPTSLIKAAEQKRNNGDENEFLKCIKIKAHCKETIRNQLRDILGIDESTLMLDLDYHGKVASNVYLFNRQ